ncbi:hypothetical protein R5R35_000471 [Gryllus longicercus]|uniref:Cytochrome c oxidase assembly protein COX20, mitochondrial n=1 Tax=Gryllus longicercus TaxID=2509291 RepID=A0AAN9Z697_9ORTH
MSAEEDKNEGSLIVAGRDLSRIPCFRKTFLTSISSGIGAGLLYFLFTSRVQMATHVGFGSFFTISLGYWFYCRYEWSKKKFAVDQIRFALNNQIMYEGTEVEKRVKAEMAGSRSD